MSDKMTLLIDSHSIGYQVLFSKDYRDMSLEGEPVGVIVGMLEHLLRIGTKFRTNDLEFCWDANRNLRRERYPDFYKAQRATDDPEKLQLRKEGKAQFRKLREDILPRIGFANQHMIEGFEADDIIARIVQDTIGSKFVMVTTDEDMFQMLDGAKFYNPRTDKIVTALTLERDWGITHDKWCMVKQIGGCKSDNVPGCPGVAELTAIQFLNKQLNPESKKYQSIMTNEDVIDRNYWIVHIPMKSCPMPAFKTNKFSFPEFRNICLEYGFDSLLAKREAWQDFFAGKFEDEE